MRIGPLDTTARVVIVAEIGNNHEGDLGAARALVEAAASCGADAVKLQTFRTELFVRPADRERYERMRRFELPAAAVEDLAALARSVGLALISTPLDLESVALLEPVVDAFKIASGDNTFAPLHEAVAETGKPGIVSAGLVHEDELDPVVARFGPERVALLQCTAAYPAPPAEANLAVIPALARRFGCTVGYSDHTLGPAAATAAVAAGARIVEKHFTLDRATSDFRDHALSADPDELRALVAAVRDVETLLGSPVKQPQPSEREVAVAARRSIVAAADLPAGKVLEPADIAWLRPGDGLPSGNEGMVLGRRLVRDVAVATPIRPEDVA